MTRSAASPLTKKRQPYTVEGTGKKMVIQPKELEAMFPPIGTIIADPNGGLAFKVVFHNYGKRRITCELIGVFEPAQTEEMVSDGNLGSVPKGQGETK